ncbi:polyketide synthase-like protein [Phaeosphaeria sp. MPI-PUGE-AT-0046c]|nr:polyketide synthase-like protein [Phaeosphaeria sp. MPI-PUGE-AT-0046c]
MERDVDASSDSTSAPLTPGSIETGGREAIAVIGFALKFPQDVTSEENLWKLLMERRSTMTEVPSNRWNLDGFYKPHGNHPGTVNSRGGHFIADDPARFDAPFFSIPPAEAECMDPQQRFLLETSYHALENAGIPMDKAMGTRTSVHVGCLLQEYSQISQRDTDLPGNYQIVGSSGLSMLANRLSWFYDFKGPSMTVDTACSGSLLALHLGCQDLLSGTVDMAVACGSNLSLVPDSTSLLSALNMMSPDSTCYSFDERANGYSRSEGFGVVLMKRLSQAIQDGDTIRAVIRSTGCNQDGHTPGITQPSQSAQERLTQQTYDRAGLDLNTTRYFEAHGTGTVLGDPTEACAISNAFNVRSPEEPLYIGALKSNIGHPESASGIAGIIKTVLVLEAGVIPPNRYPERINPVVAAKCPNLEFPLEATPWPTRGVRRASVNSFGYGGTNVHVIMDDVLSYTESYNLSARHRTKNTEVLESCEESPAPSIDQDPVEATSTNAYRHTSGTSNYKLLSLSAFDEAAVQRSISSHEAWLHSHSKDLLSDVAFTLNSKRSAFSWKTFSIASPDSLDNIEWSTPARVKQQTRLCYIFTGQGAQYAGMARGLFRYKAFQQSMNEADHDAANIDQAEKSQPLCTAIQVAIVDLLESWKVRPSTIVGHSSGEIAAAYAIGAISREAAWMISHTRGMAVATSSKQNEVKGSMLAVLAKSEIAAPLLDQHNVAHANDPVVIACYNSPTNITVSGSRNAIERIISILEKAKIAFRQLKLDIAYHSPHMASAATEYEKLLQPIALISQQTEQPCFVSTITGKVLDDTNVLRTPEYWIQNLTNPVQFSTAMLEICNGQHGETSRAAADLFVEIGPHCTLRSPVKDILQMTGKDITTDYSSVLVRSQPADLSALECAGKLHVSGVNLDLVEVNGGYNPSDKVVTSLPPYPFNDKTRYWLEGRTSAQYRFREHVHHEFLGTRVDDWNQCEARWTNRIVLNQSSWLKDHQVNGLTIFPAAGFLVMALEATRQLYGDGKSIIGYKMRDVKFPKAVTLSKDPRGTELQLTLHTAGAQRASSDTTYNWEQFFIYVYENDGWVQCCSGAISIEHGSKSDQTLQASTRQHSAHENIRAIEAAKDNCHIPVPSSEIYDAFTKAGLSYGPFFEGVQEVLWNGSGEATGAVDLQQWRSLHEEFTDAHLIHPTALDAILQMTFPAYSIYAKSASSTTVPTGFRSAWFSAAIPSEKADCKATVHAKLTERGFRNKTFSIAAAKMENEALLFLGEMETSTIGSGSTAPSIENKPLYKIQYNPDYDLLPTRTLYLEPDPFQDASIMHDKEMLCLSSMRDALNQGLYDTKELPIHLQEYIEWMQMKVNAHTISPSGSVDSLCQRLEDVDVEGRLLARVARNLPAVLNGEIDPLNLLFSDDILSDFYSNFHSNQQLLARAAAEVDVLAHKNPTMRVLEIGAGTGSATEHILGALGDRLAEYVYTDVTPSFFLKARERFESSKLVFKTLDISRDPMGQGYSAGNFDLIIAANVLHAANGIQNSLVQCRKLLRPNGRIVLLEMVNREHPLEPYIFGLLPGLSRDASPESAKNNSPLLVETEWGEMLLETSFSGVDTCISDAGYITEESISAIMISKAIEQPTTAQTTIKVVFDDACARQAELVNHLANEKVPGKETTITPVLWKTVPEIDLEQSMCVFLVDLNGNLLGNLQNEDSTQLKSILSSVKTLIWVTYRSNIKERSPDHGLVPGLARTLATENEDCRVISVTLDDTSSSSIGAANITRIADAVLRATGVPEDEYVEENGLLHIPRVIRDVTMSTEVYKAEHTVAKAWSELTRPRLTIGNVGRLNTLHFEQASPSDSSLQSNDVLVEIKAVGLSIRDLLVAQGQVHDEAFGCEFAGVVVQTSNAAKENFAVGDRVFGLGRDSMSGMQRYKESQLQRIPPGMSFCEAATYPIAFCTAYYSFVYCARIRTGDTVLIHVKSNTIQEATIQLAQMYGCKVFVTTDADAQVAYLHETCGLPISHILSSSTFDISSDLRRLTQGCGIDVVISSSTGEIARTYWECLATFGRYIDVGETISETTFSMGNARMFVSVDIHKLALVTGFKETFAEVMQIVLDQDLYFRSPLHIFKQSEVEAGFRTLQDGEHFGRVAIEMASDEMVEMDLALHEKLLFDPEATYILAGGFGGIGQSVAQWMVRNGAKYLILPSRTQVDGSGSSREDFVKTLRSQGADVRVPVCDIAERVALEQTLHDLAHMPPIKGCIQAAMVVRDSAFANMSVDDWHATLSPKLAGSWNLHELLPPDLDFFIMFSSSTGIMGSFGQSNYTAGNTYQDALAEHRVRHGQHAHAIAMSMVTGVGWVAENAQVQALLRVRGMLEEVSLNDIYDLLRFCCNPEHSDVGSQIITPLSLPADLRALGIVEPLGSTRPIYSYLHTLPSRYDASKDAASSQEAKKLPSFTLPDAASLAEATSIITEAIQTQLSSLLVVSKDDIDTKKPIHNYGVDSLVAVEMKNWFAKGVGADVSTNEILGEHGIAELAGKVAVRSRFVKEELKG